MVSVGSSIWKRYVPHRRDQEMLCFSLCVNDNNDVLSVDDSSMCFYACRMEAIQSVCRNG